jgi:hypothetical protein
MRLKTDEKRVKKPRLTARAISVGYVRRFEGGLTIASAGVRVPLVRRKKADADLLSCATFGDCPGEIPFRFIFTHWQESRDVCLLKCRCTDPDG